ncbi:MAG TPA: hypothetical protein VGX25_25770 [Actinophytocola sp.]|uniref:hypothetical protein n=1 Tax=Actinophytocola sp. TaxID=1872138 RepID=UPI002DDD6E1B|nr:hypothetical protein [Actinophytocola sp.]HEV2782814.1 hypothetical protein [Actinophytocola sp.]
MASQRLELVAPSGRRVSVALPSDRPVSSVAAGVRFAGGSYGTGFQIGPRGYHEFACTYVAPAASRDRFLMHGREVVVAEANDQRSSVATLIGSYHELMTVYAGPAPGRDRVAALFASLEITDRVGGMVVRPRAATLMDTMTEQIAVVVRGRGTMSIPGPRQALALVPKHAGARTRYGEVWKAAVPGAEGRYSFILGCPAGLAEVHLTDPGGLDWLAEIDVAWHD